MNIYSVILFTICVLGVGHSIPVPPPADSSAVTPSPIIFDSPAKNDDRPYSALEDIVPVKSSADDINSKQLVQTRNAADDNSTAAAIKGAVGKMVEKVKPSTTTKKPTIGEEIGKAIDEKIVEKFKSSAAPEKKGAVVGLIGKIVDDVKPEKIDETNSTAENATRPAGGKIVGVIVEGLKPEKVVQELTTPGTDKKPVDEDSAKVTHKEKHEKSANESTSTAASSTTPGTDKKPVEDSAKIPHKDMPEKSANESTSTAASSTTPGTDKKPVDEDSAKIPHTEMPEKNANESTSTAASSTTPGTDKKPAGEEDSHKIPEKGKPDEVAHDSTSIAASSTTPGTVKKPPGEHEFDKVPAKVDPIESPRTVNCTVNPSATTEKTKILVDARHGGEPLTSTRKTPTASETDRARNGSSNATKIGPDNTSPKSEHSTEAPSSSSSRPADSPTSEKTDHPDNVHDTHIDPASKKGNDSLPTEASVANSTTSSSSSPSPVTPSAGKKNVTKSNYCATIDSIVPSNRRSGSSKTNQNSDEKARRPGWSDDQQLHSGVRMMEAAESNPSEGLMPAEGEMRPLQYPFVLPTMHVVRNTDQSSLPTRIEPFFWYMPDYYNSMSAIYYPIFHRQMQAPSAAAGDKDSQDRRPRFSC